MLARRTHHDLNDIFLCEKASNSNCDTQYQNIGYLNRNNNTIAIYEGNFFVYGQNIQIERQNKQNMWCCLLPKKKQVFVDMSKKRQINFIETTARSLMNNVRGAHACVCALGD